ncbi:MAG: N-acetyltransferase [Deltaproteobacteria bacterium]|nr:N-acetyltransferase [Deltaproteobacteria bacterium]
MLKEVKRNEQLDYFAHKTAEISQSAKIGKGTRIWHNCQVREGAKIGTNCTIGKGVYIDDHVQIGNNVKIQNYVSVYKGVIIEDDVILAPNCTFTNDLYPRAFEKEWKVTPTLIKRGASVGANATILCGVTIGEYSMIGIGSSVTVDTLPFSLMVGNPARLKNFVCRCGCELKKLADNNLNIRFQCAGCSSIMSVNFKLDAKNHD